MKEEENARVTIMGSFRPKTNFWAFIGDAASSSDGTYEMTEVKEVNATGEHVDRAPVVVIDESSLLNATHGIGKVNIVAIVAPLLCF